MIVLSQKAINEFKDLFLKKYNKVLSDDEAIESANNLVSFVEILLKSEEIRQRRILRLKNQPDGFYLESDGKIYNCIVCFERISGNSGWWDMDGPKCLNCQKAIKSKIIPRSVCRNRDSWLAEWQLKSKYNISVSKIRLYMRQKKIVARELKDVQGRIYFRLFLLKENPLLLGKNLIKI